MNTKQLTLNKKAKFTPIIIERDYPNDTEHTCLFDGQPFTPKPNFDKRSNDYGTQNINTIDKIRKYFSIPVIRNLMSFSKKYLAVRGMDFYYPINSFNFYSFYDLCIKNVLERTEFNQYCLYVMLYTRNDMNKIIQINKRPVINYSYTAVFQKGFF